MDLVARLRLDDGMTSPLSRINKQMGRLQSATERSTSGVKRFTSSFAGIAGAIGLTAALAGSMLLVKNSIGSAFDRIDTMERFERTMTTMLGTSEKAKAALEGIDAAVTGTAYGLDTGARSVQNFVSRSIEVKKATRWFEAMGDAVAFYGDGSNEQLEGVTSAMSKMLSSGKVSMQQMETLYIAGIDGPGIYAKAVGKSTTEVQKALSSGKIGAEEFFDVVTTAMLEGTNGVQKIAGTAKEAGATWAGAIANMKFAVVRGVTAIISALDEILASNGLPSLREMVTAFGKKFESVLKSAAGAIQPFIDKAKSIYETLKPYGSVFKEVAIAIGVFVGAMMLVSGTLSVISAVAGALAFLVSPVGIAVLAITGIVLAFKAFYEKSETFRKGVDGVIGAVSGLFKAFSGDNAGAMNDWFSTKLSTEQVQKLFEFTDKVKDGLNQLKTAFDIITTMPAVDVLKALGMSDEGIAAVKENIESIKTALSGFGDGFMEVVNAAQPAVESLLGLFDTVRETVMGFYESLQPGIASLIETFTSFGGTIVEVFSSLWAILGPIFDGIGVAFGIIGDIASMVFNNIIVPSVNYAIQMFQLLWKVVGPILELLGAAIELAFGVLKIVWDTILSPFIGFITGTFKSGLESATPVIDKVGAAFDKVGGFVSGLADMVRDFAGALKNIKIPDWVSTIGGKISGAATAAKNFVTGGSKKSHYHGIERVPRDGWDATLHKGEMVLTAREADIFRNMGDITGRNVAEAVAPKVTNIIDFKERKQAREYAGMDYETATTGVHNDNRTYNSYETASDKGGTSGNTAPVTLNVRYEGGATLDKAEMDRFAGYLVRQISAAHAGGA